MSVTNVLTETECWRLFQRMFPNGLRDPAIVAALAPEGWERSPLVRTAHPTPAQLREESHRIRSRIQELRRACGLPAIVEDIPDATGETWKPESHIDPVTECAELLGSCLWHLFSDNHEVRSAEGSPVELGTGRLAAAFLADFLEHPHQRPSSQDLFDYIQFYIRCNLIKSRADLTPVYALIFLRMRRCGLAWRYVHPMLALANLGAEDSAEAIEFERWIREANYESIRVAREQPPPAIVVAYQSVYGQWPEGWPPSVTDVF